MECCRSQKDLDGAICVTLSVDKSEQLMKIGTSADLGKCKALRKDGLPCTMYTNKCAAENLARLPWRCAPFLTSPWLPDAAAGSFRAQAPGGPLPHPSHRARHEDRHRPPGAGGRVCRLHAARIERIRRCFGFRSITLASELSFPKLRKRDDSQESGT